MAGMRRRIGSVLGPEGRVPQFVEGETTQLAPNEPARMTFTKTGGAEYRVDVHVPRGLDGDPSAVANFGEALAAEVNTPSSTGGATLRELFHTKTQERVHVADYGARGDGISDNTQAIRDAINATPPGGTLVFREGEYHVGDAEYFQGDREMFRLTGDITVLGNGARIVDDSVYETDRTVLSVQGSNVTIDGLKISNVVADGSARPVHRGIGVGSAHGIDQYQDIENVTITNCEFYHSFYPVQIRSDSQYSIRNIRVTDNRSWGIGDENCGGFMFWSDDAAPAGNVSDVVVANNHVYDVTTAAAIGLYGVHHGTVTGNLCDGSNEIGAGIQTERGAQNITISGNTLKNHYNGIWVHDTDTVSVSGNTITHTDNRHDSGRTGIRVTVQGTPREQPFIARGITITGNTLEKCGITGFSFNEVQENDTRIESLIISGNSIRCDGAVARGILMNRRVQRAIIQGNYIDGSTRADIEIQGHASYPDTPRVSVVGNVLYGDNPLIVLEEAYVGFIACTSNVTKNPLPDNVFYHETIGYKRIMVMREPNQQAPIGSLGMTREGKIYKKEYEYNTGWTEL